MSCKIVLFILFFSNQYELCWQIILRAGHFIANAKRLFCYKSQSARHDFTNSSISITHTSINTWIFLKEAGEILKPTVGSHFVYIPALVSIETLHFIHYRWRLYESPPGCRVNMAGERKKESVINKSLVWTRKINTVLQYNGPDKLFISPSFVF